MTRAKKTCKYNFDILRNCIVVANIGHMKHTLIIYILKNTIATNSFHCIPYVAFIYIYKIKSAVFFCESYQERSCDWSFDNPPKVSNICVIPAPAMII